MILPCKYIALEIRYSGPGFDMADAKRVNTDMFSFNPNELHGGGGSGGGTGSGLGVLLAPHGSMLFYHALLSCSSIMLSYPPPHRIDSLTSRSTLSLPVDTPNS